MKLREKMWLWGQTAGSHHAVGNPFKLPGENKMTPMEGGKHFGIPNVFRVVMADMPKKEEFNREAQELDGFDTIFWSLIGSGGSEHAFVADDVLKLAEKYEKIQGAITDDFLNDQRMQMFTPEMIRECREKLHNFSKRKLDLYTVVYVRELTPERQSRLQEFDAYTMWTWNGCDIPKLDENYEKLRTLVGNEKKIMAGCYMWDYGDSQPMREDWMQMQLDTYYSWLKEGKIDGVVVCSNCIADLNLPTEQMMSEWLRIHGDEDV